MIGSTTLGTFRSASPSPDASRPSESSQPRPWLYSDAEKQTREGAICIDRSFGSRYGWYKRRLDPAVRTSIPYAFFFFPRRCGHKSV